MYRIHTIIFALLILFLTPVAGVCSEVNYRDYLSVDQFAVYITTKIDSSDNPSITLSWLPDTTDYRYEIFKKKKGEKSWQQLAVLSPGNNSLTDSGVRKGIHYEYQVHRILKIVVDSKDSSYFDGYGYVSAGWEIPPEEYKGRLLLLIDETMKEPLKEEIARYTSDLRGSGWLVSVRYAPRAEKLNPAAVLSTKSIIDQERGIGKDTLRGLIILGRVPVPYSGKMAPDGHQPEHYGAWPADAFYTTFSDEWTDTSVTVTEAERTENHNTPGDGKFDQSLIPSDVVLEAGRIDFYNLTVMEISEAELLRRYLNKNHDFRHGILKAKPKALLDDNFGMYSYEAFSALARSDFHLLFQENANSGQKYLAPRENDRHLWAYGSGSGHYTQASWVCNSMNFRLQEVNSVFNILFGSLFGDWDSEDNLMRCAIGSSPSIIACIWSGRPFWHLHHIALGETLGYSAKISQNNSWNEYPSSGKYGYRMVHITLMGDPSLKMYYPLPPKELQTILKEDNKSYSVELTWEASEENNLGYNIYRASSFSEKFEKINSETVKENTFTDKSFGGGRNIYMVRALKLEQVPSGSYYNLSQGIFSEILVNPLAKNSTDQKLFLYPNPAENSVRIAFKADISGYVKILIYDSEGKRAAMIAEDFFDEGIHELVWNTSESGKSLSAGIYHVVMQTAGKEYAEKLALVK